VRRTKTGGVVDGLIIRCDIMNIMKRKKKGATEGYSVSEMRVLTNRMIDESVERLRRRLRAAWKKAGARNVRHGAAV